MMLPPSYANEEETRHGNDISTISPSLALLRRSIERAAFLLMSRLSPGRRHLSRRQRHACFGSYVRPPSLLDLRSA